MRAWRFRKACVAGTVERRVPRVPSTEYIAFTYEITQGIAGVLP